MLENIEKIIRRAGCLHIEPERYGNDIMVCLDIMVIVNNITNDHDGTICYHGTEIYDTVDTASSPGDIDAIDAIEKLETFSEMHPEFLYAKGKTLDEALINLEKRAVLWNQLICEPHIVSKSQIKILLDFVTYLDDNIEI